MPTCTARRKLFPKHPGSNEALIEGFGFGVEYLTDRDHQFRFFPPDPQPFASKDSPTYLYCLPGASGGGGSRREHGVGVHALNNASLRPNLSLSEILLASFFVTE